MQFASSIARSESDVLDANLDVSTLCENSSLYLLSTLAKTCLFLSIAVQCRIVESRVHAVTMVGDEAQSVGRRMCKVHISPRVYIDYTLLSCSATLG